MMMKSLNDLYLKLKVRQLRLKRIEDAMAGGSVQIMKQFGALTIEGEKRLISECEAEIKGILEQIDKHAVAVDLDMMTFMSKQVSEFLNKERDDGKNG